MDKEYELRKIEEECNAFFKNTTEYKDQIIVFGQGNVNASIVLVGEAPGKSEVLMKTPFVGKAGEKLNEFLEWLKIDRRDIYITNVVKFRPVKINSQTGNSLRVSNRAPNREEIKLSRDWLFKEINVIKPEILVSLGNVALKVLTGDESMSIGQVHGNPIYAISDELKSRIWLYPLYHPASVIYRRELKETYNEDVKKLKQHIETITQKGTNK